MITYIRALEKGGYVAFGGCLYDDRQDALVVRGREDEIRAVTLTMPEDIASVLVEPGGAISVSTPAITADTAAFNLSGLQAYGLTDLLVTLASGAVQRVRLLSKPQRRFAAGRDYWYWSAA